MKLDTNMNTLISEIMSGTNPSVLVVAPDKYNKEDFVTELSSRYPNVFWFDALADDLKLFCSSLLKKVVADDSELVYKLEQLMFWASDHNYAHVVISAVLERIASMKGDVLMVFERLEHLSKDRFKDLVALIKLAPSNLKVVMSASSLRDCDYSIFEPKFPIIVDEEVLAQQGDVKEFLSDISDSALRLLCYMKDYPVIPQKFATALDVEMDGVLKYLSRKGGLVRHRDDNYYIHPLVKEYFEGEGAVYQEEHEVPYPKALADYYCDNSLFYRAIVIYDAIGDVEGLNRAVKNIFGEHKKMVKICDYFINHPVCKIDLASYKDYPYVGIYKAASYAYRYMPNEALKVLSEILPILREEDRLPYCMSKYFEMLSHYELNEESKIEEILTALIAECAGENDDYIIVAICLLPEFMKFARYSIAEVEKNLSQEGAEEKFWYVKVFEDVASAYFVNGSYAKALAISKRIKEYLPHYVIPTRYITLKYYSGDVEYANKLINTACDFAVDNKVATELHLIYTTKALIARYFGRFDEADAYFDKAYDALPPYIVINPNEKSYLDIKKDQNASTYYAIAQRVIHKANNGDFEYARGLAHAFLKQAHGDEQCSLAMHSALAYAYYKMGDKVRANKYATLAIRSSKTRSTLWLLAMGIATNCLLAKDEIKDVATIVSRILRSAENNGMLMVIVDNADEIYAPILEYARQNHIEQDYVAEIDRALDKKHSSNRPQSKLAISMFGDVSISVDGKEIQWKTRKSKELFLHYILAGELGIDRNIIIDFLWKNYLYESAINNLKTTNNIIRKTLSTHNIDFKLDYINSKYILKLEHVDSDYHAYKALRTRYQQETSLTRKIDIMNEILALYKSDFATDMNFEEFKDERKNIKQELIINLLRLVRQLAKQGDYMESKRFLSSLVIIDKHNDYSNMVAELDRYLNVTE